MPEASEMAAHGERGPRRALPWMAGGLLLIAVCVPIAQALSWPAAPLDGLGLAALADVIAMVAVLLRPRPGGQ